MYVYIYIYIYTHTYQCISMGFKGLNVSRCRRWRSAPGPSSRKTAEADGTAMLIL